VNVLQRNAEGIRDLFSGLVADPEPRLRSRFPDAAACQMVPNGGSDYRQYKDRTGAGR